MTIKTNHHPEKTRNRRWQSWLAAGLTLVTVLAASAFVWLVLAGCNPSSMLGWSLSLIVPFCFVLVGLAIVRFRPLNRVGWLCLAVGALLAVSNFADPSCLAQGYLPQPVRAWTAWLTYSFATPVTLAGVFFLLPMIFPTGRFLSRRWRNLTLLILVISFSAALLQSFVPNFAEPNFMGQSFRLENPTGWPGVPDWWVEILGPLSFFPIFLGVFAAIGSIVLRYRRSHGDERQQIKYLAYFFGLIVFVYLIVFDLFGYVVLKPLLAGTAWEQVFEIVYELSVVIVFAGVPISIGLAILKYRLYDIDILIRRTLVYGALTVLLGLIYYGGVVLLQQVFGAFNGQQESPLAIVVSTLAIAALFNPLRTRLQLFIDRRFYRRRYDAERTLAEFAEHSRNETDLASLTGMLAQSVIQTMQPESLNLWLRRDDE